MTEPAAKFDALIHAPIRLQVCGFLNELQEVEFQRLRDEIDISDSVLSKHLKSLEDAGYVYILKKLDNGRVRTWVSLSPEGMKAFNGHVLALKAIIG